LITLLIVLGSVFAVILWLVGGGLIILNLEEKYRQNRYIPLLHSPNPLSIWIALIFWPILAAFMLWNRKR